MDEYDVVRVIRLERTDRLFDGTPDVKRPPEVGDTGTIVCVLAEQREFIVECTDGEGLTVWLGDFSADELEKHE